MGRRVPDGTVKVWVLAVFGVTTLLYVAAFVLNAVAGEEWGLVILALPVWYVFSVVGLIIALRRPGNRIAWICLAAGFAVGIEGAGWGLYFYGVTNPGSVPNPEAFAVLGNSMIIPGVMGVATFLLLLFPDGRLPSPRWRWIAWLAAVWIGVGIVVGLLDPNDVAGWGRPNVENPWALDLQSPLGDFLASGGVFDDVFFAVLLTAIIGSILSMVIRFRRSTGVERQQLKWFVFTASIVVILFLVAIDLASRLGDDVGLAAASLLALLPISIGIAVLRYRLYEIDRIVSRTVTYGLVAALLTTIYAGIVLGLPRLIGFPGESPLLVAAATLAAAALFNPLRQRIQARVDRRFNRARYNAQREVEGFTQRLRNDFDLDDLANETLQVVTDTVQPSNASLWIREDR